MHKYFFSLIALLITLNACESTAGDPSKKGRSAENSPSGSGELVPDGMAVFRKYCVTCHGTDGKLGLNGAKDLTASELPLASRLDIITNGKNMMTPFKALLNEAEIKAVAEYTMTLKSQTPK